MAYTAKKQWHCTGCGPPIALGRSTIGPQVERHVLGCYAGVTGITASWIAPFRNKYLFSTIIAICFENYLAAPTASSHHYGLTYPTDMAVPPSSKIHSAPASSAHTSIYTNCRYRKYGTGQRKAIESWLWIQLDITIDTTKSPFCPWATGGMAMSSGSKSEL